MKDKKLPKDFTLREIIVQLLGHGPDGDITSKGERECLDTLFNFLFAYHLYGLRAWLNGVSNASEESESFEDIVFPMKEISTAEETYIRDKFYELSTSIKINRDDWLVFIKLDHRKYADDYLRNQLQGLDTIITELEEDKPEFKIYDIYSDENKVVAKNSDEHRNRLENEKHGREIKKQLIQNILDGIQWPKIEWIKGQYKKNPFWRSVKTQTPRKFSQRQILNLLKKHVKDESIAIKRKYKNMTVPQILDQFKIKNLLNQAQKSNKDGPGLPDNKPSQRTLDRWIRDALREANLSSKGGRPSKSS